MLRVRCVYEASVKIVCGRTEIDYSGRPRLGGLLHYDDAGRGKQTPKWLDGRGYSSNTGHQAEFSVVLHLRVFLVLKIHFQDCNGSLEFNFHLSKDLLLFLPRPPRVAPRPRTTPAGAAAPTPFPMSLSTATLLTDMEKFLCREGWRGRTGGKTVECEESEPSSKLTN